MSLRQSIALVGAFVGGKEYRSPNVNANKAPEVLPDGVSAVAAQTLIDEGRRQLAAQGGRLSNIQGRAQHLLTITLAEVGFLGVNLTNASETISTLLIGVGLLLALCASALAGATSVVAATFDAPDTTQLAHRAAQGDFLQGLGLEYARAVIVGEDAVADRLTHFRRASRLAVWGAISGVLGIILGS